MTTRHVSPSGIPFRMIVTCKEVASPAACAAAESHAITLADALLCDAAISACVVYDAAGQPVEDVDLAEIDVEIERVR